ncbi:TPM domain-containing protein [Glacieibacterium megasporae]|uniref:TPM domain-containing protein n=1 Tax=Glacieibacterium megasporae TaxID=2835787 RepID=UPI001C1E607C|nr:TPM domain-containing protein [Polymorphobacter megasporae]UAJ11747.1 TPM domain-containing protein [Polymorphobacter megasporae]
MTKLPLLLALLAIASSGPAAARPALALAGWVTDDAHVLPARDRAQLTRQLAAWEKATGHQMVVVTMPSLHGQDIKAFTTKLGDDWGVGRAKYSDGVVILVVASDRKVRIGVGYGLEPSLPDAWCHQLLTGAMIPRFRRLDYASGIAAGVSAIIGKVGTVRLPVFPPRPVAVPSPRPRAYAP